MACMETNKAGTNTLSYEGFRNVLFSQTKRVFSEEFGIEDITVEKTIRNNDTQIEVLCIKHGSTGCMPNIHMDDLYEVYENGENIDEIIDAVKEMYIRCSKFALPDLEKMRAFVENIDEAKGQIEFRLINADTNAKRLEDKPFKRFGEFALSYQLKVGAADNGFYVTLITNDMMEQWNLNIDELHRLAVENMDPINNFVLQNLSQAFNLPKDVGMFMLSNKQKLNGATMIVFDEVRQKVGRLVGGDYFILPSSVHEVIIMPKRYDSDVRHLTNMIRSANRDERIVKPDDFLSDNLYEYNMDTRKVSLSVDPEAVLH
ncbi:MAG: DUF5688 family protein [Bacillota bacterium]|nr:DUF5688 family protein [Bacillota bacterium]